MYPHGYSLTVEEIWDTQVSMLTLETELDAL